MASLEVIQALVAEGMSFPLPAVIARDVNMPFVSGRTTIAIGARRSGKTYRMIQRARDLMNHGVPRENILFIDFEDDRLYPANESTIADVVDQYLQQLALQMQDIGRNAISSLMRYKTYLNGVDKFDVSFVMNLSKSIYQVRQRKCCLRK